MADIAGIFHWPLSELLALTLDQLLSWHERAIAFHHKLHPPQKGGRA